MQGNTYGRRHTGVWMRQVWVGCKCRWGVVAVPATAAGGGRGSVGAGAVRRQSCMLWAARVLGWVAAGPAGLRSGMRCASNWRGFFAQQSVQVRTERAMCNGSYGVSLSMSLRQRQGFSRLRGAAGWGCRRVKHGCTARDGYKGSFWSISSSGIRVVGALSGLKGRQVGWQEEDWRRGQYVGTEAWVADAGVVVRWGWRFA